MQNRLNPPAFPCSPDGLPSSFVAVDIPFSPAVIANLLANLYQSSHTHQVQQLLIVRELKSTLLSAPEERSQRRLYYIGHGHVAIVELRNIITITIAKPVDDAFTVVVEHGIFKIDLSALAQNGELQLARSGV